MTSSFPSREFVIDANVLFSSLISGGDKYLTLLANNRVFIPDFALEELQSHQEIIGQKTKLPPEQLQKFILTVFERITVVPNLIISTQNYYQAFMLCRDTDRKIQITLPYPYNWR